MRQDEIYGKLPDMMIMKDGRRVSTIADWEEQRKTVLWDAVELEYGGMPPKPEVFRDDLLSSFAKCESHRITCGTKEKTIEFYYRLYHPTVSGKVPVIISGDENFETVNDKVIDEALRRGYCVVKFDRTETAPDVYNNDRSTGLYPVYPDMHFSAISVWAWSYSRVIDAILNISYIDPERIAVAGHSRGGKTVLLAGATDERIRYIDSNNSGSHGCACWRFHQVETDGSYSDMRSEKMEDMFRVIAYWMGPDLKKYVGHEAELPHDMHFIKALIAPRILFENNGYDDIWGNPRGSYATHVAAKTAWELYGKPENCMTRYRPGGHAHGFDDFCAFFDVIDADRFGKPMPEEYFRKPYDDLDLTSLGL